MKRRRNRYPCPCCGCFTLPEQGQYDICPVCFWEDDPVQSRDEWLDGCANKVCLKEARKNYLAFGACEKGMLPHVRKPLPEELIPDEARHGKAVQGLAEAVLREIRTFQGRREFLASHRYFIMKVKRFIKWAIPLFVLIWFPFMFYMRIRNYHVHVDDPFTLMFGIPCTICCIIGCFLALKRKEIGLAVACGLAAASCAFFCYWIYLIPFCTMCEPIDRSDLGFMLEPFADKFYGP